MKALIADDDRGTVAVLSRSLARWGIETVVAHDGGMAWDLLHADPSVSLAIVDWMMPTLVGPDLCRRIREHPVHSRMYVLLLTARDSRADLVAGLDAGADDYLVKPVDAEELRARVQVGLRILSLQTELAGQVEELQEALTKVKQLKGLLPICSYCKRVRSDEHYWQQLESYVTEHSGAEFSHGICPTCFEAVRAQFEEFT
jgi:DNA-binding response OmpR family regulator